MLLVTIAQLTILKNGVSQLPKSILFLKGVEMEKQTVELLKECDSGCKMAINSMNQVMEYVKDPDQESIIRAYTTKHEELERRIREQLTSEGEREEEPGLMASAMSWFSTELKMAMNQDSHQIAKIMMDGCNMGIQSVAKYLNKNDSASKESIKIAEDLVKVEEDFMQEMKKFL